MATNYLGLAWNPFASVEANASLPRANSLGIDFARQRRNLVIRRTGTIQYTV